MKHLKGGKSDYDGEDEPGQAWKAENGRQKEADRQAKEEHGGAANATVERWGAGGVRKRGRDENLEDWKPAAGRQS
jgi:hypothetical protein